MTINRKKLTESEEFERIKAEALDKLSPQYKTKLGAEMILHGFHWLYSDEGLDYWNEVFLKLENISSKRGKI